MLLDVLLILLFIYYNALILSHLANGHNFRVIFGLEFFIFGSSVQSIREIGFPGNLLICPNWTDFFGRNLPKRKYEGCTGGGMFRDLGVLSCYGALLPVW